MIIKNCPCIKFIKNSFRETEEWYFFKDTLELKNCQNITNCLLKQIVQKCQEDKSIMAQSILELMEIEECE